MNLPRPLARYRATVVPARTRWTRRAQTVACALFVAWAFVVVTIVLPTSLAWYAR